MAAQKGKDVIIRTTVSGSLTTIGGMRSSSIVLNDEMVDASTKDSRNRVLLPQAGINSMTISGSGVFTDTDAEQQLRTDFAGSSFTTYNFTIPDLGTYAGTFQITSLEFGGEYNGEATFSVTLESSGAVTFTAA